MTTGTLAATPARGAGPPQPAAVVDPEARGTTTLADRVVAKVAARAVAETTRAGGAGRRLTGRLGGDGPARVDVEVDGTLATVSIRLSVTYPAPVREVAREVRAHVVEQVRRLTGLQVKEVDVTVVALTTAAQGRSRVR